MSDMVNHPTHYTQGDIECIDCIKAATIGKSGVQAFCVGNIIKYIFRFEEKNGLEDVKKAKWYIERLIKELDSNENDSSDDIQYYDCGLDTPDDNEDDDEIHCVNCVHWYKNGDEEPCRDCKNNFIPKSEEYKKAPCFFVKRTLPK